MTAPIRNRDNLPVAQAVMLDVMRLWVIAMRRGVSQEALIEERLDLLGAGAASPHLKRFMFALSAGCTRMIEVQCTCKSEVGADEQALLEVLSLTQELCAVEAAHILREFVTEEGAQNVIEAAEGISAVLSQAGCFLQATPEEGCARDPFFHADIIRAQRATLH